MLELLAQSAAVEAEHLGSLGLVTLDVVHHGFQERRFHFGKHQVVHVRDGGALKMGEIVVQCLFDTAAQGLALCRRRRQVLFQVGVVAHGCCPIKKILGHRRHAAFSPSL
ncbi:hypothetical protein D3C72_1802350 [compost metagenome]